ncbi:anti-sigma factor [Paenibacillus sp. NFR01]|uniref:anti-sigma factor family protein n=1 Tax=Paenibacillus sp. NFR01 TaxID=1566279 RepID=UPI0008D7936C|nr:zf-HC2 domain-containing protein [Paenibacillus sp. NFR01]SET92844.1 Putative zinc-finger [Paenibacillus sp. NFR01]
MNCVKVKEWMPHYLDQALPKEAEHNMRLHLATCEDCAAWLAEAQALEAIWNEAGQDGGAEPLEIPDLYGGIMAEIDKIEAGRRARSAPKTEARSRTAAGASWMHYGLAVCLTFVLLQFGVFKDLAFGISEFNGHMSASVSSWFSPSSQSK